MNRYQEKFKAYMEESGLHATRQRLAIAGKFSDMPGHYTVEELYEAMRETEPGIGQATVYRTVKLLADAGLVFELRFGEGASRFEAMESLKSHDHLVCKNCGSVVDIHSHTLEHAQNELAREHGFLLEDRAGCLIGLCPACCSGTVPERTEPRKTVPVA